MPAPDPPPPPPPPLPPPPPPPTDFVPLDNTYGVQTDADADRKYYPISETLRGTSSTEGRGFTLEVWTEFFDGDPFDFYKLMLGNSTIDTSSGQLKRDLPEQLPYKALDGGETRFFCTDCTLLQIAGNGMQGGQRDARWQKPQPNPVGGNYPKPKYAKYALAFTALLYDVKADSDVTKFTTAAGEGRRNEFERFCIIRRRYNSENERINSRGYIFKEVSLQGTSWKYVPNETVFRRTATTRLEVKLINVPRAPKQFFIEDAGGKCNSRPFLGYAEEKVRFESYEVEPITNIFGLPACNITYLFFAREDDRTWNECRVPSGGYGEVRELAGGTLAAPVLGPKPFRPSDFSGLFHWG